MDENSALENVIGRIEMLKVADDDGDQESSNQHLRMAIDDLSELLRHWLVQPELHATGCVMGVKAIALIGAAACEPKGRARTKCLRNAEDQLSRLKTWIEPPSPPRWKEPTNDMALYLSA